MDYQTQRSRSHFSPPSIFSSLPLLLSSPPAQVLSFSLPSRAWLSFAYFKLRIHSREPTTPFPERQREEQEEASGGANGRDKEILSEKEQCSFLKTNVENKNVDITFVTVVRFQRTEFLLLFWLDIKAPLCLKGYYRVDGTADLTHLYTGYVHLNIYSFKAF